MKQTVCLLLATLVVFQLCTFIYAAPYETTENASEYESNKGGSGGSSGGSSSSGSHSGSSNAESHTTGSGKDESTGKGAGMLMDQFSAIMQIFNQMKDKFPWPNMNRA